MNARQDWEKGTLALKLPGQIPEEVIVYNMKNGKQECLEVETSEESESSMDSTLSASEEASQGSSECDSSLEVYGVNFLFLFNRTSQGEQLHRIPGDSPSFPKNINCKR